MAFDGFTMAALVRELNDLLAGGRINKIEQPEPDALLITAKGPGGQQKVLLSASASLPLLYVTQKNRVSPLTAPNFCMLLRKHIGSARILSVTQPGLERAARFQLEHLNDMGDVCRKVLVLELMGKHSNVIFLDDREMILDSIKHIPANVSSVREVLPGRPYFIPQTQGKLDPMSVEESLFMETVFSKNQTIGKSLSMSLTGVSAVMANEICFRAGIDADEHAPSLDENTRIHLYHTFCLMTEQVREGDFSPNIVYRDGEPVEFGVFAYQQFGGEYRFRTFESVSMMLECYYSSREEVTRIRQKSADLRRVLQTCLERDRKKYQLQEKQLKDTEKKDKYRIYGELLNVYGYNVPEGAKVLRAENYYTNEEIDIPLDPTLSAAENSKKYFERYNKLKRTEEALTVQAAETARQIEHLESIAASLTIARDEADLSQIKEEMTQSGYIKRHTGSDKAKKNAKAQPKSKPFHYISADGYDMYVGRNNFQNDELTFRFADGDDWWFHAKKMPGSHVIVKGKDGEMPDRVFEEAGRLAAYYSSGRDNPKVEIDYIQRKHIKKPPASNPGFVIYHTNYSLVASPDISGIREVE